MKKPILTTLLLAFSVVSSAALAPMTDEEMGDVTGQAITKLDVYNLGGQGPAENETFQFVRITTGLEIEVNANINEIVLGANNNNGASAPVFDTQRLRSGSTAAQRQNFADINLALVSLGKINISEDGYDTVKIQDPWVEFVYANRSGEKQLVGVRTGANRQDGILAGVNHVLSGNLAVSAIPDEGLAAGRANPLQANGRRFIELTGNASILNLALTSDISTSPALSFEGSRNFWLSFQSETIKYLSSRNYQSANNIEDPVSPVGTGQPNRNIARAQRGFWINLNDNVFARGLKELKPCPGDRQQVLGIACTGFYNPFPKNCFSSSGPVAAATHSTTSETEYTVQHRFCK